MTAGLPRSTDIGRFVRSRQFLFDVLLALGLLIMGLATASDNGPNLAAAGTLEPDLLYRLLILAMTVPQVVRRIVPVPVVVTVLTAWAVTRGFDYPGSAAEATVLVAFHTLGTELSRRRALLFGGTVVVLVVSWTMLGAIVLESVTAASVVFQLLITAAPLWLGMEIHQHQIRHAELESRAERAEREREKRAREAVTDERARIARELHDVVAHQMTVIALQADGARRVAGDSDPRVLEALDTITATGRAAMTEMRRMVGLLRSDETDRTDPTDQADRVAGSHERQLEPMPTLVNLDALIERVEGAGLPVTLDVSGYPSRLDDGAELSAYRVVQEALTNTIRHGGTEAKAVVSLGYEDDRLVVTVDDSGRGPSSWSAEPSDGHGLVGMRERVAVHGGEFAAGPRPGGGFRVRATIPYERADVQP